MELSTSQLQSDRLAALTSFVALNRASIKLKFAKMFRTIKFHLQVAPEEFVLKSPIQFYD